MDNYFTYFAAKGNHPDKNQVLALEKELEMTEFNEDVFNQMTDFAFKYAFEKYQRPIGLRINDEGTIYQALMNGISDAWLLRKEKVCLETKHSSYYIFLDNIDSHQYDHFVEDESYGVCGGSFPLIINGEFKGAITCTGLRPSEDHQVVIETIKHIRMKGK